MLARGTTTPRVFSTSRRRGRSHRHERESLPREPERRLGASWRRSASDSGGTSLQVLIRRPCGFRACITRFQARSGSTSRCRSPLCMSFAIASPTTKLSITVILSEITTTSWNWQSISTLGSVGGSIRGAEFRWYCGSAYDFDSHRNARLDGASVNAGVVASIATPICGWPLRSYDGGATEVVGELGLGRGSAGRRRPSGRAWSRRRCDGGRGAAGVRCNPAKVRIAGSVAIHRLSTVMAERGKAEVRRATWGSPGRVTHAFGSARAALAIPAQGSPPRS